MAYLKQIYIGKNNWWRWLLMLLIFVFPYGLNKLKRCSVLYIIDYFPRHINTNVALGLGSSLITITLFFVAYRLLHKRPIKKIITSRPQIDFLRIILSFIIWAIIIIVSLTISYLTHSESYKLIFQPEKFFLFFTICFLIMPFQILSIELIYRGYLLQFFGFVTKKKWVALVLASSVYGLVFMLTSSLTEIIGYQTLFYYFFMSLMLCFFVLADDGLEIAIGTHFANNFISAIYLSYDISVDAIFHTDSKPGLIFFIYIPIFILFPFYTFILFKIFKWKDWKQKVFKSSIN